MSDSAILPLALTEALGTRYLSYALSTIMSRSLPDVRDGLKPVHRRLLYAMRQLRLTANAPPKKSARVVGDVIGQYHPHGDQSIYDALVRLAQSFSQRYPLVDGQGNFGNIDGDNAAAMRYTEARMTEVAEALLAGIDEDAIDFRETYDGQAEEPVVLPAGFPNLLANGSQGIAVGMATSIPPHNAGELAAALIHLVDHPDADTAALLAHVKGPDLPTGGVLVESPEAIAQAYATGRGGFRLRARWETEQLSHGQYQVVVTELPFQTPKSRLVERIASLLAAKKLPLLEDVRDESADEIRLVLVPRSRNVDAEQLMEHLFRQTDLETRLPLNLNVLDANQTPRVMSLAEALKAFLDHRLEVLLRRSRHRLGIIDRRLEILDGYLIVFLNIDEVIRIIREEDEPKASLMATFALSDVQAEAVLNLRLRALRRLEEMALRQEHETLSAEREGLLGLLASDEKQRSALRDEFVEMDERFGRETDLGRRRTAIAGPLAVAAAPVEALVEREPITVYLSQKGWLRAVKGHQDATAEVRYKDGDRERFILHAETTDRLLVFATDGRCFTIAADKLPRGRGFGEPVRLTIDLDNDADVVTVLRHDPEGVVLVASTDGRGFLASEKDLVAQTRAGRQILNLSAGAEAKICAPAIGDHVAVLGDNRRLLVFPAAELSTLARGKGVILQKYREGGLADAAVFSGDAGLSWGRRTLSLTDLGPCIGRRAQTGRAVPRGFPKAARFG